MLTPEQAATRLVEYSTPILAALTNAQMQVSFAGAQLAHQLGHLQETQSELAQYRSDRQRLDALVKRAAAAASGAATSVPLADVLGCLSAIEPVEMSCDGHG